MLDLPYYLFTNERLEGMLDVLDIVPTDHVLAVLGSGDHAFTLLERAGSVTGVDTHSMQIALAQYRREALRQGNFPRFLKTYEHITERKLSEEELLGIKLGLSSDPIDREDLHNIDARNAYFMESGRLQAIRDHLDNLTLIEGDIFALPEQEYAKATKVYLSNCLMWIQGGLERMVRNLPRGALIYSAETDMIKHLLHNHPLISLDQPRTEAARPHQEIFHPSVWVRK